MKYYNYILTGLFCLCAGFSAAGLVFGECWGSERASNLPAVGVSSSSGNLAETESEAAPAPDFVGFSPCYELTASERALVESVVMAEAGGEPYEGQQAVAQCILNACVLLDIRPAQVVTKYKYSTARPTPTEVVKLAVMAVFDDGVKVIDPEAIYFYAPARASSAWHESQVCVATIGGHRFFKEAG